MQKNIKSFDGTKINYEISRKKNKDNFLIFLHGIGGDLEIWNKIRPFFDNSGISTIAVDFRGCGKSDKPKLFENYNFENFAKDINEIIKKENISNPILIGYSFGTMIALTFQRLYPNLSKKYVFISGAYKTPRRLKSISKNILFFDSFLAKNMIKTNSKRRKPSKYKFFKNIKEYNFKKIVYGMIHFPVKSWIFIFGGMEKFNEKSILKKITKPVFIIGGKKDSIIPINNSKRLHRLIKNSQLKIFPYEDHDIISSIPKELYKEIYSFIKKDIKTI